MGNRIKLLMTIADLSGGGAERVFSNLLFRLPRDKFDIYPVLWRPIFHYPCPDDLTVNILEKHRPWHAPRVVFRLRRYIDEIKPDVVLSALKYTNILTGEAIALSKWKPPWICKMDNAPESEIRGLYFLWAKKVYRRATRVVSSSRGVGKAAVEYLGLDPGRVVIIYNLLDFDQIARMVEEPLPIKRAEDSFIIVHAGRLHPQKNQAMLLRAFSKMRHKNSELWILGQGKLEKSLKALAFELAITDRVKWLGFQKNPFPFFKAADCFALSSDWEGFGNVIVEAMFCGTPVVATDCPYGVNEIIENGKTGLLVPTGDIEAFSDALGSIAAESGLRKRLAESARNSVMANFNPKTILKQYESVIVETASGANR